MEQYSAPLNHRPDRCDCLISSAYLRAVRNDRLLSLEAIVSVSTFTREHLAAVERGDQGKCVTPDVIRAYEKALGGTMQAETLRLVHEQAHSLLASVEMLTRLYHAAEDMAP